MGTFFLLRLISALTPTNSQHTTTTTTATPPPEHIPLVRRFQRQSLLLRWNQRPLVDATSLSVCRWVFVLTEDEALGPEVPRRGGSVLRVSLVALTTTLVLAGYVAAGAERTKGGAW